MYPFELWFSPDTGLGGRLLGHTVVLYLLIYLFIFDCTGSSLLLGLFLVVASRGSTLVAVRGLLIALAFLAVEHTLQGTLNSLDVACGLGSCSSRALEHRLNSCGTRA